MPRQAPPDPRNVSHARPAHRHWSKVHGKSETRPKLRGRPGRGSGRRGGRGGTVPASHRSRFETYNLKRRKDLVVVLGLCHPGPETDRSRDQWGRGRQRRRPSERGEVRPRIKFKGQGKARREDGKGGEEERRKCSGEKGEREEGPKERHRVAGQSQCEEGGTGHKEEGRIGLAGNQVPTRPGSGWGCDRVGERPRLFARPSTPQRTQTRYRIPYGRTGEATGHRTHWSQWTFPVSPWTSSGSTVLRSREE